jgi:CelD/BcsL family acetyltransferase involved in cellulose biosynthesis
MSALTATVITQRGALDAIVPRWNALLDGGATGTVFSTPEWQLTWLDVLPGVSPRYIVVSDDTGRMRGLLPLARRERRVGALSLHALELGGEAVAGAAHLGLIARAEDAADVWAAAAEQVRVCASGADLVRFAEMDSDRADAVLAVVPQGGRWSPCHPRDDVAPRVKLPAHGTDVVDSLRSSRRAKLRYYERHFAASHPSGTIALNEERMPLDAALDVLDSLHAARWRLRGESGVLADPVLRAFSRRFARLSHERGWLRLFQLFAEDRVVATLLTLHWRGVASAWLLGWTPDFGKFNVSELLFVHSMRVAAREGLGTYDFVRGNETYKFRFASDAPVLRSRQWAVTTRGKVAIGASRIGATVLASARRWRTRAERVVRKLRAVKR